MKICCCWLYAIGVYGFPPKIEDIKKAIREMADMGFKYIELEGMGYENMAAVARDKEILKEIVEENTVQVVNFAPLIPQVISMDRNEQKKALDYFRMGVETAKFLGSTRVWIDSYNPPVEISEGKTFSEEISYGKSMRVKIPEGFSWQPFWHHFVSTMRTCNEIAKDHGLEFLIEPRVHEVTSNSDSLLRLFDAIPDDNLGAILDTAHQYAQKELLPIAIEKLGEKIRYIHIADNDGRDNRHLPPGEGTIDWDGVFTSLKKTGYDGFYAVDLEKLPNPAEKFKQTKRTLEQYSEKYNL